MHRAIIGARAATVLGVIPGGEPAQASSDGHCEVLGGEKAMTC